MAASTRAEVRLVPLSPSYPSATASAPGKIAIGRGPRSDCRVLHPGVSREHAELVISTDAAGEVALTLVVMSRNGVQVRSACAKPWTKLGPGTSFGVSHGSELLLYDAGQGEASVFAGGHGDPTSHDAPHFSVQVEDARTGSSGAAGRALFSQAAEHEVMGRYEFLREVGRGTFGVCWHARERRTGAEVAAKVISKAGAAASGTDPREVLAEARLLARLRHPNVLGLTHAVDTPANVIIVTDFCDGGSLHDVMRRTRERGLRLTDRACRGIAAALLRGTAYLHSKGFIHRDIKPANVLVQGGSSAPASSASAPLVRLADFGLAKFADRTGTRCGTPLYMAPELLGDGGYGPKADTFACGLVLHELLTGSLPWTLPGAGGAAAMSSLAAQIRAAGAPGFVLPVPAGVSVMPDSGRTARQSRSSRALAVPVSGNGPVEVRAEAWDLVCNLVCPEGDRLGAAEALSHPWLAGIVPDGGSSTSERVVRRVAEAPTLDASAGDEAAAPAAPLLLRRAVKRGREGDLPPARKDGLRIATAGGSPVVALGEAPTPVAVPGTPAAARASPLARRA